MIRLDQSAALGAAYAERLCAERRAPRRAVFATLARKRGWKEEDFEAWARGRRWADAP